MVDLLIGKNVIKDVELVVFDKDGTILDLYTYWASMVRLRADKLCEKYRLDLKHRDHLMLAMGVDVLAKKLRPEGPVGLLPRAVVQKAAEEYLSQLGHKNASDVCYQVFSDVDAQSRLQLNNFIQPIPGALELIKKLKSRGIKGAIATTDRTERAELAADFLGIRDLVDIIVGADKVERSKPHPDMLKMILDHFQLSGKSAIMVGDAETDVEMGIAAGFCASVGVCSGLTERARLLSLTSWVVDDVSGIYIK